MRMAEPLAVQKSESFYALYDNGSSSFYDDAEETVQKVVENPALYASSFGHSGTCWDYVQEIAARRIDITGLLNLEVTEREAYEILSKAGFRDYRLNGSMQWIIKTIEMIKRL